MDIPQQPAPNGSGAPDTSVQQPAAPVASSPPDGNWSLPGIPASPAPSVAQPAAPVQQGLPAAPQQQSPAPAPQQGAQPPVGVPGQQPPAPVAGQPAAQPQTPPVQPATPAQPAGPDLAAQLAEQTARNQTLVMAGELGITPQQLPAWQQEARNSGFGDDIRSYAEWVGQVEQAEGNIADYITSYEIPEQTMHMLMSGQFDNLPAAQVAQMTGVQAPVVHQIQQYIKTERNLTLTARMQIQQNSQRQAQQAQWQQQESQQAMQYATQKLGPITNPVLNEVFGKTPPSTLRPFADALEEYFQSRLTAEKTQWAAAYEGRATGQQPMPANAGMSPAGSLAHDPFNPPDMAGLWRGVTA